ncbi:MAG TPA: hypothetical protein VHQ66_04265 [Myxococcota bacterium]|nr:hypothetical protein [Myxococcota bacterium]
MRRRFCFSVLCAALLAGLPVASGAQQQQSLFTARIVGNSLDPATGGPQVIAGFTSSLSAWRIQRGQVTLFSFGARRALVVASVKGLVLDPAGFNPSPTIEARLVCHDDAGAPFLAARTDSAPMTLGTPGGSPGGNATLVDVIDLPAECFAPIVLFGGDSDLPGPTGFFAVSGL